jgi:hypothetical protein
MNQIEMQFWRQCFHLFASEPSHAFFAVCCVGQNGGELPAFAQRARFCIAVSQAVNLRFLRFIHKLMQKLS